MCFKFDIFVLISGEVMVCVLDFKRDVGLWHGILCVSTCLLAVLHSVVLFVVVHAFRSE